MVAFADLERDSGVFTVCGSLPPKSLDEEKIPDNSPGGRSLSSVNSSATLISEVSTPPNGGPIPVSIPDEKWWMTTLQVSVPFFLAGVGTIGAGLVLGRVQEWPVFCEVSALFVLVPALLGLKGNLDMCLASRLSTQANCGNMTSNKNVCSMIVGNLALVQVQAIVAAMLVSLFAVAVGSITSGSFNPSHALLLMVSSVSTATTSCFTLDLVMIGVIFISHRINVNPDNVATPLAASIGDVVSLTLLATISSAVYHETNTAVQLAIVGAYLLILPLWVVVVLRNVYTKKVLKSGWVPVLSALMISGLGGLVLDAVVKVYKGFVVFQPIINGIGGNLVSVQASRISTLLHQTVPEGVLPSGTKLFVSPWKALFNGLPHARTARILLGMTLPGHLVFIFIADYIHNGCTLITDAFALVYLCVALLQVLLLLYSAHVLIHFMWRRKMDPDNSAIPFLTALGDLSGSGLLALAFMFLHSIKQDYIP